MNEVNIGVALILLGLVGGNALLALLHVLDRQLLPRHDPLSAYGISTYRRLYAVENGTFVLAGSGAALALHAQHPHALWLPVLCLLYAAGVAGIIVFPMGKKGAPRTMTTSLHNAAAGLIFTAATVASFLLPSVVGPDRGLLAHWVLTGTSLYLCATIFAMLIAIRRRSQSFGVVERIAAAGLSFWLIAVLVCLSH